MTDGTQMCHNYQGNRDDIKIQSARMNMDELVSNSDPTLSTLRPQHTDIVKNLFNFVIN